MINLQAREAKLINPPLNMVQRFVKGERVSTGQTTTAIDEYGITYLYHEDFHTGEVIEVATLCEQYGLTLNDVSNSYANELQLSIINELMVNKDG